MDWDWDDGPPQDTPSAAPRDDRPEPEEPLPGDAPGSSTFAGAIEHFDQSAPPDDDERTQLIQMPPDAGAAPPDDPPLSRSAVEPATPGAIERVRRGTPASVPAAYSTDAVPARDRPRPPRDRAARARRRKQIRRRRLVALAILIAIVVLIIVLVVRGCGGSGAPSSAVVIGALFIDRHLLAATGRR